MNESVALSAIVGNHRLWLEIIGYSWKSSARESVRLSRGHIRNLIGRMAIMSRVSFVSAALVLLLAAPLSANTTAAVNPGGQSFMLENAVALAPSEVGLASYYHDRFQGRKTANGERFDQNAYSAAHRTLPFGTEVRVTRVDTGRSVVVTINDRGPFKRGRVLDLSRQAARELDIIEQGLGRVKVEVLSLPTDSV